MRVVVLTKLPGHLPVKTRLAAELGEAGARRVYLEMLADTVALARGLDPCPVVAYSPPGADPHAALPGVAECTFLPAPGDDGAACLEHALAAVFDGRPLVALGGDAPDLPRLPEVVARLGDHDAVLVPTPDGGFSCLGLLRPVPGLAEGFAYGGGESHDQLRAFLEAKGLAVAELAPWPDVDTPADLAAYRRRRRDRTLAAMEVHDSILDVIGETPLVRLRHVTEGIACSVYAKLENMNPGGSIKDRIGPFMIEKAERAGKLKPGGTVVESTSGNTGVGLALACSVKGYQLICTMPDKMSQEKINMLRGYGAKVVVTPTAVEYDDPRHYVQTAKRIAKETPNSYYIDQFENPDNPEAHYLSTGPELYRQFGDRLSALVLSMGTGGTLTGAGRYLKEKIPGLRIVGADPEGSIYTSIVKTGAPGPTAVYKVEGIGHDYVPGTCDPALLDDCVTVSDRASFQMARRLAREEGIFAGGSSGTNVVAALKIARTLPADAVVCVVICDTGERYLSKQWNDDWMRDNQFLEDRGTMKAGGIVRQRARDMEPLIDVPASATVREAIEIMRRHDLSQLPVRRDGELVGCINENQAIDLLFRRDDLSTLAVEEAMGPPLTVLPADTPAEEVARMLAKGQKAVLVDPGDGNLVVVTKFDLIHAGA